MRGPFAACMDRAPTGRLANACTSRWGQTVLHKLPHPQAAATARPRSLHLCAIAIGSKVVLVLALLLTRVGVQLGAVAHPVAQPPAVGAAFVAAGLLQRLPLLHGILQRLQPHFE